MEKYALDDGIKYKFLMLRIMKCLFSLDFFIINVHFGVYSYPVWEDYHVN